MIRNFYIIVEKKLEDIDEYSIEILTKIIINIVNNLNNEKSLIQPT